MKGLLKKFFSKKTDMLSPLKGKGIAWAQNQLQEAPIPTKPIQITKTLQKAGFEAYLVGGCVRDLLLGLHPKDFDIVTNAHPEQIIPLFRSCRLIGRRFRIAHVRMGRDVFEVSTFRGSTILAKESYSEHGMIMHDNEYGTLTEDVWRRDFTMNALYYDPVSGTLLDYIGGVKDIKEKRVRMIGEVASRYREDPVRMLRALRLSAKLGLRLEGEEQRALKKLVPLLEHVAPARLFLEMEKLFSSGASRKGIDLLRQYGLLSWLFPFVHEYLSNEASYPKEHAVICAALENTDKRIKIGKSVTPAFLLSVFFWFDFQARFDEVFARSHKTPNTLFNEIAEPFLLSSLKRFSVPRRFILMVLDIWHLQRTLEQRRASRCRRLLSHPKFRAAYDFLCLRAKGEPALESLAKWWTEFQELPEKEQEQWLSQLNPRKRRRRR